MSRALAVTRKPLLSDDTKAWARRIGEAWQKSVESIIETGQLLIEAKHDLGHGSFLAMVESELPADLGIRSVQMLMAIGDYEPFSNTKHVSHLPKSWGTLYELTKLDTGEWGRAEKAGLIRPDVERKEVVAFRKQLNGIQPQPEESEWDDNTEAKELAKLGTFLTELIDRWPPKRRDILAKQLAWYSKNAINREE